MVRRTDLFAVVCDGLEDRLERRDGHSHVQQMGSEEEVVDVTQQREGQVPQVVQELLGSGNEKNIYSY